MAKPDRARWTIPALLTALALAPAVLVAVGGDTMVMAAPLLHCMVVLVAAGVTAVAASALSVAGARAGDGRAVLMGVAFSTMTSLLAVRGPATPGVLIGPNGLIALAGGLSIPVGTALLALSALPALRRARRVRPLLVLQGVMTAGVVTLAAIGLAWPSLVPRVPEAGSDAAYALLAAGLLFCLVLANRAARTHALTRRPADLLVAVGWVRLGVALV